MDIHAHVKDLEDIERAQTFSDLADVALRVLRQMPRPISMVCGPISTGGSGSVEKNLERFHAVIDALRDERVRIFSQMFFENKLFKMKTWPSYKGGIQLLEEFYRPIFESGFIYRMYFMPNWQTSMGATWERGEAQRLGIRAEYVNDIVILNYIQ